MQIIPPDFVVPTKTRKRESPTLLQALEAVKSELLINPGAYYAELELAVRIGVNCSSGTAQRAIKLHYSDGSLTTTRDGNKKRYYWEDTPQSPSDRLLPVHRRVLSAAEGPRVGGEVLSVCGWMRQQLEVA